MERRLASSRAPRSSGPSPPDQPWMSTRLWFVIAGNGVLRVAGGASGVLVGVYLADLARRGAPIDAAFAGVLAAIAFGAELVGALPFGFAADVVSTRTLMVGSALMAAAAAALFGLSQNVNVLISSRVLEGVAAAAGVPALLAHLTDATADNPKARAQAMSFFEMSLLVGLALGGVLGSVLWRMAGAAAFVWLGGIYIAAAALLGAAGVTGSHRGQEWSRSHLWQVLSAPAVWRLAPVWLCMNAIVGVWLGPTFYFLLTHPSAGPQLLAGLFADDPTWLGPMLLVYACVFGTGLAIWSRVLPRVALTRVLRVALVAMLAVCGGLWVLNHLGGASLGVRWGLTSVVAGLVMVESGFTPAALTLLAGVAGSGAGRGSAMGIYSFLLSLGALAGSLIAGAAGERWAIDGLIGATLVLATVALVLLRLVDPTEAHPGEMRA